MSKKQRMLPFSAVLSALVLVAPFKLFAQDIDLSGERAGGDGGEDEVIKDEDELDSSDELSKSADTWPAGDYLIINGSSKNPFHLGPTGLWGFPAGQNIWAKQIDAGSPADGKVLPGDVIYGANGKAFPADRDVRYYFAMAITEAETKEAGGKLILNIRRDGKLIQVPIQLKVMGSYSSTTPRDCEKSKNIIAGAEEYMRKGLRPETGLPNNGKYMFGPWNDSVLFLLASGNPEMQGLVRRYIRNSTKAVDAWKNQESTPGFDPNSGWGIAYIKMLYGEYYHRTGDPIVLPYLEENGFKKDSNQPEEKWSPPVGPTRYGLHAGAQMAGAMGSLLAHEAGLKINKDRLFFDLKYLYTKRAEYGYVKYFGYGAMTVEQRQIEAPEEMTPELMAIGKVKTQNGKLGTAAALFSMVNGYEKAVDMCSIRCRYAFNYHGSHGGAWFGGFWTPVGAYHAGPEKFTQYMKSQQSWRELFRDHTGAMWEDGNARGKDDVLSTGYAIHWVMPRKKLRMFGAPRSMFGQDAPAYMKEALAAHRNRDYAGAEQLTLKLQASGTVPAADKARVDNFLDSVKTLKESVAYDLTFAEGLIKKGNYALASVELPQLEMVVSPNDSRLKAIAKALASPQAQAHIAAARKEQDKRKQDAAGGTHFRREAAKEDFQENLESLVTLVKDGANYVLRSPNGRLTIGTYPQYEKNEQSPWLFHTTEALTNAPTGWEQPGFDDSKWKKISLPPKRWPEEPAVFLRTIFEVGNVKALKSLRVREMTPKNGNSSFTLYINGKVVAKVTNVPRHGTAFDLKPEALALLKNGKNTLAISTQRREDERNGLSLRLEGILKDPSDNKPADPFDKPEPSKKMGKTDSKPPDTPKKPEPSKKKGKTK
jgi:Family of unknown function (DUF6288)/Beta-galactosidase jelly roll domain